MLSNGIVERKYNKSSLKVVFCYHPFVKDFITRVRIVITCPECQNYVKEEAKVNASVEEYKARGIHNRWFKGCLKWNRKAIVNSKYYN